LGGIWEVITVGCQHFDTWMHSPALTMVWKRYGQTRVRQCGHWSISHPCFDLQLPVLQLRRIIENKNHDFLLCVTVNVTHHLPVGGADLSQWVQEGFPVAGSRFFLCSQAREVPGCCHPCLPSCFSKGNCYLHDFCGAGTIHR
jgi:hypothetical protein